MDNKFPKSEKLKSSKTIARLFSEGNSHFKYPVKMIFLPSPSSKNNLVAFAVPKRNFKLAVDRNRIKRQLREAYRLNKYRLQTDTDRKYAVLFLFTGKKKPHYDSLAKAMVGLLAKLSDKKINASH